MHNIDPMDGTQSVMDSIYSKRNFQNLFFSPDNYLTINYKTIGSNCSTLIESINIFCWHIFKLEKIISLLKFVPHIQQDITSGLLDQSSVRKKNYHITPTTETSTETISSKI